MRVLLDTSLLLPTLGIDVEGADEILKRLKNKELYYSDFSILECLWVVSSLKKKGKFDRDSFESGIKSILEFYSRADVNAEIVLKAFEMYELGHKDMIDCLLYSTVLCNNMKFASLDKELRRFVKDNNLSYMFFD